MRAYLILAVTLLLTACAAPQTRSPEVTSVAAEIEAKKQRELVVQGLVEAERRLYRVGYPLITHGAPLCGDKVSPSIGIVFWNNHRFQKDWQEALTSQYGVTDLIRVVYVAPGSPGDKAGVRAGDVPLSLDGWPVPVGNDAPEQLGKRLQELGKENRAIEVVVQREGRDHRFSVVPEPACDVALVLDNKDAKNAYADGRRIVVYRGLMDFFKSDEEAALVIAHELAHNAMGHIDAKKQNALVGGVLGFVLDVAAAAGGVDTQGSFTKMGMNAGAGTYSVDFEKEADYVGLYLMAAAGYEIDGAADFWRRMAVQDPRAIQLRSTHPTTPERFVGIEKAVAEIKNKIEKGLPLEPEIKQRGSKNTSEPQPQDHSW
jgi:beta-barrel assembly-enhancing protease